MVVVWLHCKTKTFILLVQLSKFSVPKTHVRKETWYKRRYKRFQFTKLLYQVSVSPLSTGQMLDVIYQSRETVKMKMFWKYFESTSEGNSQTKIK